MNPPVMKNKIETDRETTSRIRIYEEITISDGRMTVHQIDSTMNLILTIKQSHMTKTIKLSRYVTEPRRMTRENQIQT